MTGQVPLPAGQPVIIGAGLAGVMTALSTTRPCVLACAGTLEAMQPPSAASMLAQGGMAAAVGAGDSPALHAADTLAAGAGLCDPRMVARITAEGPAAVARLAGLGVAWDRHADGTLQLGLEAAHGHRRIAHAGEDATGATIMRALVARVRRTGRITVVEHARARDLVLHDGAVAGVELDIGGQEVMLPTTAVILATGGMGGLFADTTNPPAATGSGLAMAVRAGAVLGNMEFVQFHPTALSAGARGQRLSLISEAVRGEGAVLVDEAGARFTSELATRDSVSRAVWRHMLAGHTVYLDARASVGADFPNRFPAISALCAAHGINPVTQPVPVRPAAHYHMGGIMVDQQGRSDVPGLWAVGEAACTGLHGANRLASNSLLEAVVCGTWTGHELDGLTMNSAGQVQAAAARQAAPAPQPPLSLRHVMSRHAGVIRTEAGLRTGLLQVADRLHTDAGLVCAAVMLAALHRRESRGGHFRSDCPDADTAGIPSRLGLAELRTGLARVVAQAGPSMAPLSMNERMPS
ncbi:L-aspartate oxidase [Komagataeibacter rhaeticus]|uniref:L-aspartate oxidase n=1 Tax=Komagataeibacter rhaeticus TaxID=215221 RepID=UPI0004D69EC4|nr:L-aspartate oxidase [Komagataeibacter rhaeticus]KDU96754.1 L-aspartate oxidase [Komagataeibacter rhaeticus AF1]MBL7241050.1 L-aspartate oxidase [Komagataeibacter rhaeticus]PYD54375.1 L-aspartate oxidase [Komagataeibacter rhaeticus]GBQ14518.1 succinate dehydrogenase flavoprotein subunit [Komagataeibacter rhaeticus DSM 16663]